MITNELVQMVMIPEMARPLKEKFHDTYTPYRYL